MLPEIKKFILDLLVFSGLSGEIVCEKLMLKLKSRKRI